MMIPGSVTSQASKNRPHVLNKVHATSVTFKGISAGHNCRLGFVTAMKTYFCRSDCLEYCMCCTGMCIAAANAATSATSISI